MDWKEFLRPNKEKIVNTFKLLLLLALVYVIVGAVAPYIIRSFSSFFEIDDMTAYGSQGRILGVLLATTAPFIVPAFLVSGAEIGTVEFMSFVVGLGQISLLYIFGCYMSQSKKWLKAVAFYLVAVLLFTIGATIAINASIDMNNNGVGKSCSVDSDCYLTCERGEVASYNGERYISPYAGFMPGCCFSGEPVCVNNRCEVGDPVSAIDPQSGREVTGFMCIN